MYQKYVKRAMDFILALVALIVLSPILAITAMLVRVKLGSPVLFKQLRPGKDEKIFEIYKFRTMTDEKDENGQLLADEVRLTKFGRTIRITSLDELPELFNIIRGDMAVIGPRPLLVQYLPLYNQHQKRRHEVRPGLSGLAQINGRNNLSWEDKFDLDVEYVDKISFFLDIKIICMTILKVFQREGISAVGEATMPEFFGTRQNINNLSAHDEYHEVAATREVNE